MTSGGAGVGNPADHISWTAISGGSAFGSQDRSSTGNTAYGPVNASWFGEQSQAVTVHGLQWQLDAFGMPHTYTGYGEATTTVSDAGTVAGLALPLAPVTTGHVAMGVDISGGHVVTDKIGWLAFSDWSAIPLWRDQTPSTSGSYAVPQIDASIGLQVTMVAGLRRLDHYEPGFAAGAVVDLRPGDAPNLSQPANGSVGVTTTRAFTYVGTANTVTVALMSSDASSDFIVYTDDDTLTLPSVPALGLVPSGNATFFWGIYSIGPYDSIDAYVGDDGGIHAFGLNRPVTIGTSQLFQFNTAAVP